MDRSSFILGLFFKVLDINNLFEKKLLNYFKNQNNY